MSLVKAAFFDRDGTLIEEVPYLSDVKKIKIIPESMELCRKLQTEGYKLFIVTNQSGIARKFFPESFVQNTHKLLEKLFAEHKVYIEKYYYCPHHPDDNCECRKPKPGMLVKASKEYNIDLSKSLMFGDKEIDVKAGEAVNCKSFYIQNILEQKLDLFKERLL